MYGRATLAALLAATFRPQAVAQATPGYNHQIAGKGWFTLFRLYGPLEPWFDKAWRPGEIELVN